MTRSLLGIGCAFPSGILCCFSLLFHGMLCWEGHSRSSRSSGREFQAALCFLAGNSWKAEGGKEIFPAGWIQRVGGWTLELQTSGKELGYGGRLFPALRGEIWEFFHDVEKVWIEIPALLKPGAS